MDTDTFWSYVVISSRWTRKTRNFCHCSVLGEICTRMRNEIDKVVTVKNFLPSCLPAIFRFGSLNPCRVQLPTVHIDGCWYHTCTHCPCRHISQRSVANAGNQTANFSTKYIWGGQLLPCKCRKKYPKHHGENLSREEGKAEKKGWADRILETQEGAEDATLALTNFYSKMSWRWLLWKALPLTPWQVGGPAVHLQHLSCRSPEDNAHTLSCSVLHFSTWK